MKKNLRRKEGRCSEVREKARVKIERGRGRRYLRKEKGGGVGRMEKGKGDGLGKAQN